MQGRISTAQQRKTAVDAVPVVGSSPVQLARPTPKSCCCVRWGAACCAVFTCDGEAALLLAVDEELLLPAHEDGRLLLQLPAAPSVLDDQRPAAEHTGDKVHATDWRCGLSALL
jgi:hypothetical protein